MSNEIFQAIEQVGREKGIEVDIIIQAVEDAYAAAAKKYFRTKEDLGAKFDRETGSLLVFARKKIVEDVTNPDLEISPVEAEDLALPANDEGIVEIHKPREELAQLGRIAAQAAKQIIFQKVREAERDNVYKEYIGRVGELVNGVVKRFERGNIIIDLGRTEGLLPKKEQSKAERYSQGDRIRAVIVDVDRNAKGPQVILSRTDERLLIKLFEMEVPEIYDGTVAIERAVHDSGDRAKVAVRSKDRDVDPVGACVGMKGSRVQSIIRELRGEKIDIVEFSDDVSTFVTNALNPAKINRVQITDSENRTLEVVVDDEQLSLAIGKKGQNVRLASRLVGWKIDIKSEQEKKREVEAEMERMARDTREMATLEGVSEKVLQKLREGGIGSLDGIIAAQVEGLTQIPGVGPKTAEKIVAAAEAGLQARAEREEAERLQREQEEAEAAALQAEEQARLADEAAAIEAARQEEAAAAADGAAADSQAEDGGGNGASDQEYEDTQTSPGDTEAPEGVDEVGPASDHREESLAPGPKPAGDGSDRRTED
ncbi:MAG TPA: transcription termination factor NusA [Candidatus Polarisedimenticolia bacterium]|jgi:N utilization substance protein A|nr:transcription termination factor NusA [Candidatus Polarisedimenticolia bacterium]